jgi:uncharacterized lipoprotein YddW (UPF0748 family)
MKRGLWVEAEGSSFNLASKTAVDTLLADAEALKVSSLYLQVHRRGYAWYTSRIADTSMLARAEVDPLRYTLEQAEARGIEVHAWINCCNFGVNPSPRATERFSDSGFLIDSLGGSLREYHNFSQCPHQNAGGAILDTPGAWVDPSSPHVRSYLCTLVDELGRGYPTLSGVHLDFIRYPYVLPIRPGATVSRGVDIGYGPALTSFGEQTGFSTEIEIKDGCHATWKDSDAALSFDAWRRAQLTGLVRSFRGLLPEKMLLSAATLSWTDRAYLSAFQDWRTWLQDGVLSSALPMAYTADTHHFELMLRQALAFANEQTSLVPGIGCYKCPDGDAVLRQLDVAESLGCSSAALFSYGAIKERKELFDALKW